MYKIFHNDTREVSLEKCDMKKNITDKLELERSRYDTNC